MKIWKVGRLKAVTGTGVASRVAAGYVLLIALILLVAAIGVTNIGKIRRAYDVVLDERIPRISELQKVQDLLSSLSLAARDALLTEDAQKSALVFASIDSGRSQAGEQLESLQKALEAEGTKASVEVARQIGNDASGVLVGLVKFSRYLKAQKREQALTVLQDSIQPQIKALSEHIGQYQQQQIALLAGVKQDVILKEASVLQQTIGLATAALLTGAMFAWWIVRSVVVPLREIKDATGYMAKGDFSRILVAKRQDEVGQVVNAFNLTASGLTSLVGSIRESASQVNEAAESITERNTRLEERAREQTKALNVAMEFIDGVQKVIDDNVAIASQATGLANDMASIATRSSQSVSEAVHEMQVVKQSSQKITDIISLIDGIAFQTNILALNAAVEAARAGEQGRGFAVVAAEVRSLAGRSAQASKEIKELILASQARVAVGTEKVQSISRIMESVTQTSVAVKQMVEQISSGSQVQSQHMGDMVGAVGALLAGNDSNVEIVSGMHVNLQDLRETAHALSGKVDEFRTRDHAPQARLTS